MTPLAQYLVGQLTLPVKRRTFKDPHGLLKVMDDIHCFECTAVKTLAEDLAKKFVGHDHVSERLAFLPAPKTWIEMRGGEGGHDRMGFLFIETADGTAAH